MFCIQCNTPSIKSKNSTLLLKVLSLDKSAITFLQSNMSQTGRNMKQAILPNVQSNRRWCTPVSFSTFFENIFITLNPAVANKADPSPIISNETSLTVAMLTPIMIGKSEM